MFHLKTDKKSNLQVFGQSDILGTEVTLGIRKKICLLLICVDGDYTKGSNFHKPFPQVQCGYLANQGQHAL
jgi:hypothetical protein